MYIQTSFLRLLQHKRNLLGITEHLVGFMIFIPKRSKRPNCHLDILSQPQPHCFYDFSDCELGQFKDGFVL